MSSIHPIDLVTNHLFSTPPMIKEAADTLKGFLRHSPYALAWQLYITIHELTATQLEDRLHMDWLKSVGMDVGAARLYLAAARHIVSPSRVFSSPDGRFKSLHTAKTLLEFALVTPMDEMDEVAKAYEPIALATEESSIVRGAGGSMTLPPHLKRRYDAALSIFEFEGPWPTRHHSSTQATHCKRWSATFQKMFSTYVTLATMSLPSPQPFPSTVQLNASLLSAEELQQLKDTQLRRISLAMRQAIEQCPNEEILLINYCAFVAAVTNSTENARAALIAHLAAQGHHASVMSPAIAALSVALNKISSPSDLFQLLTSSTTKIAQAHHCLDLSVLSTLKRFRDIGKEATESTSKSHRWHMFSEWLEVECNAIGNKTFCAKIAEKGYDKLQAEAQSYSQGSIDALALFAHQAHSMHYSHGTPAEGQLIAEKLVEHLSKLTKESILTGTSTGDTVAMETSRLLASVPVNTLKEAVNLLGVTNAPNALRYINGDRPKSNGVDLIELSHQHSVGPFLPLMTNEETRWAIATRDIEENARRYDDDTGRTLPNEWKRRFHRCQQAMPWGLATIDDSLSPIPMKISRVEGELSWKIFVPPPNAAMKDNINPDSDDIRAPFALRGAIGRALVIDDRTQHRLHREDMYRTAEGKKKSTELEQLPHMIAKLLRRLPSTTEGCASVANVDPIWLIQVAFMGPPLNLGALVENMK